MRKTIVKIYKTTRKLNLSKCGIVYIILLLSLVWMIIPLAPVSNKSFVSGIKPDRIDYKVSRIRDLAELQREAERQIVQTGNFKRDMALALTRVVALHGVHGVSRQTWRENWIANVLDYGAPRGVSFSGRMRPEDLLKDNVFLCSQASLLLQDLFRRNDIEQATVRFNVGGPPPHSAVAAKPDGIWRYYDPSYEPIEQGIPFNNLTESDRFKNLYATKSGTYPRHALLFGNLMRDNRIKITGVNGDGPWKGIAFQRITAAVSNWGWIFTLGLALSMALKRKAWAFQK